MSDLFISYAREDQEFVHRLQERLEEAGKDAWVDWKDIPVTSEWFERIGEGIREADSFVFVISRDSVRSEVCAREIGRAAGLNKRIVPILLEAPDDEVHEAVARHHWISFDGKPFEAAVATLVEALEVDLPWVQEHTRWLQAADRWQRLERDSSGLLRGSELAAAEAWLGRATTEGKDPQPTPLQSELILASRRSAARRQRLLIGATSVGLVVAIGLAVFALIQRNQAIDQKRAAQSQAMTAGAEQVLRLNPPLSVRLAAEATRIKRTPDAESMLRVALANLEDRTLLEGHNGQISDVEFSPDGQLVVTASNDGTARIWAAGSGVQLRSLEMNVGQVAFSPDGERVVTAGYEGTRGVTRIWDVKSGEELAELSCNLTQVDGLAFSPDGEQVVTASSFIGRTAQICDAHSGDQPVLRRNLGDVEGASFSPDGDRFVAANGNASVGIWDVESGERLRSWHHENAEGAAFSRDGELVLTTGGDAARIWDAQSGEQLRSLRVAHQGEVEDAAFSRDGERVSTVGVDGKVRVWDWRSGEQLRILRGPERSVAFADFSLGGERVVTAGGDVTARVWDAGGDEQIRILRGHRDEIEEAVFSPDGKRVVTAGGDGTARIWDAESGEQLQSLRGDQLGVTFAAFSSDGERVVTAGHQRTTRIWDAQSGEQLRILRGPDGEQVVSARGDGTVQIRDPERAQQLQSLRGGPEWTNEVLFSPDGELVVAAGGDGTAPIWEAESGEQLHSLRHQGPVTGVDFSPDGERVVAASGDGTARIWGTESGEQLHSLRHQGPVEDAAFSPGGEQVVTADAQGTVRFWDAQSGGELRALSGHDSLAAGAIRRNPYEHAINSVDFSPDGEWVVTAGIDGTARIWACGHACTPDAELLNLADKLAGTLSDADRAEYLPE